MFPLAGGQRKNDGEEEHVVHEVDVDGVAADEGGRQAPLSLLERKISNVYKYL